MRKRPFTWQGSGGPTRQRRRCVRASAPPVAAPPAGRERRRGSCKRPAREHHEAPLHQPPSLALWRAFPFHAGTISAAATHHFEGLGSTKRVQPQKAVGGRKGGEERRERGKRSKGHCAWPRVAAGRQTGMLSSTAKCYLLLPSAVTLGRRAALCRATGHGGGAGTARRRHGAVAADCCVWRGKGVGEKAKKEIFLSWLAACTLVPLFFASGQLFLYRRWSPQRTALQGGEIYAASSLAHGTRHAALSVPGSLRPSRTKTVMCRGDSKVHPPPPQTNTGAKTEKKSVNDSVALELSCRPAGRPPSRRRSPPL